MKTKGEGDYPVRRRGPGSGRKPVGVVTRWPMVRVVLRLDEFITFKEFAIREERSMSSMGAYIIRLYLRERKLL